MSLIFSNEIWVKKLRSPQIYGEYVVNSAFVQELQQCITLNMRVAEGNKSRYIVDKHEGPVICTVAAPQSYKQAVRSSIRHGHCRQGTTSNIGVSSSMSLYNHTVENKYGLPQWMNDVVHCSSTPAPQFSVYIQQTALKNLYIMNLA